MSKLNLSICFFLPEAKPTLPTNFEENTWATLKSAISAIFLKQRNPCDLEALYQVHVATLLSNTVAYKSSLFEFSVVGCE